MTDTTRGSGHVRLRNVYRSGAGNTFRVQAFVQRGRDTQVELLCSALGGSIVRIPLAQLVEYADNGAFTFVGRG